MYQLALIMVTGVVNPVANYPSLDACNTAKGAINPSPHYSVACLPQTSPEQVKRDIEQGMEILGLMLKVMKKVVADIPQ